MAKYHINPETGRVNICRAEKRPCPVSTVDNHFPTKEEALKAREAKLTRELGTFSSASKKSGSERETTKSLDKAFDSYYEYALNETWRTPEADEELIRKVAENKGLNAGFFKAEVLRLRALDEKRRQEQQAAYAKKVEEVIAATPHVVKRNSIVAVKYDSKTVRLMKVDSIRRGVIAGPTVEDGELYEPIYMEDVDIERNLLRPNTASS